uniref:Uncharacterized protein n=1 Tax=Taeniopygia guttata TaxID=59729 RepID=A0A674HTW5_TAEGU
VPPPSAAGRTCSKPCPDTCTGSTTMSPCHSDQTERSK